MAHVAGTTNMIILPARTRWLEWTPTKFSSRPVSTLGGTLCTILGIIIAVRIPNKTGKSFCGTEQELQSGYSDLVGAKLKVNVDRSNNDRQRNSDTEGETRRDQD
jgi:hypothetical protein